MPQNAIIFINISIRPSWICSYYKAITPGVVHEALLPEGFDSDIIIENMEPAAVGVNYVTIPGTDMVRA